jgi:altronate dehydratase
MSWHATALSDADNVATVLEPVAVDQRIVVRTPRGDVELVALDAIALCHKIALADVPAGAPIVKYGECIGEATAPIRRGAWVHVHNLRSRRAQPTT